MTAQIISKSTAGWLSLIGIGTILALNILLIKPFFFGLFLTGCLILVVIFLYQPAWGIGIFLILRPIIDNGNKEYSFNITKTFSLNLNALLGILTTFLLFIFLFKNRQFRNKIPFQKTWLLFILLSALSFFYSIDQSATLRETIRLTNIFLLFSSIFLLNIIYKEKRIIACSLILSAVTPFFVAVWQIINQTGLLGTPNIDGRLFGTFSHPNTFAGFILIIIALFWFKSSQEKPVSNKKIYYTLIGLSIFLLLETFSRGAWISLAFFFLVLGWIRSPKIIFVGLAIFFLFFLTSQNFRFRLYDIYRPTSSSSLYWRFQQWGRGLKSWEKRPYLGWGSGTETIIFEKQYGFFAGNPYTHNDFLRAGIENGLVGFIIYGILMGNTLIFLVKNVKKNPSSIESILALATFSSITLFSLSSNLFRATAVQWTLWSFLAITTGNNNCKTIDFLPRQPKIYPLLSQQKN